MQKFCNTPRADIIDNFFSFVNDYESWNWALWLDDASHMTKLTNYNAFKKEKNENSQKVSGVGPLKKFSEAKFRAMWCNDDTWCKQNMTKHC